VRNLKSLERHPAISLVQRKRPVSGEAGLYLLEIITEKVEFVKVQSMGRWRFLGVRVRSRKG
jgi:hypothetical protein